MALALIMYGQEEGADAMIEQLSRDKDPVFRYGAMYVIGMAYCGTGNNSAIRRLLHVAVSDVKDDTRRAAVTCLGFVLFRTPEKIPDLVSLLAESFSPHVRYGVCMAIGIGCAGTARADAVSLLEPMIDDSVDYVRQGALLAMALVLMQAAEARTPKVKAFREKLTSIIEDKHKPPMTKLGAILAAGIVDAGGRNVTVSMQSHSGIMRAPAVVGLVVWAQYWYWFPFLHFLSLSFQRTAVIGLNKELKMPKSFGMVCNAKASQFKPPDPLKQKTEEKKERVETVTLSTTARAKARSARKKEEGGAEPQAEEAEKKEGEDKEDSDDKKDADGKGGEKEVEKEPPTHRLANPARVTHAQKAYVAFDPDQRYTPVHNNVSGIMMLSDVALLAFVQYH